ncbi:MAG: DUF4011 domain-containing protein [Betaproteobacteria bacterium]|nr:DUF4011 domain-containing protein [Betaproteobacteria bacterium]
MSSPVFFVSREYALPPIKPGEKCCVENIALECDHNLFSKLAEAEKGVFYARLAVDAQQVAEAVFPLELLTRNQWGGLAEFPENAAAFVQPNDPAVDRLLVRTLLTLPSGWRNRLSWVREFAVFGSRIVRGHDAELSLGGYVKGNVGEQLAALWRTLHAQDLNYILPPPGFEQQGQKVRNPTQVMSAGQGTCLDISLLVASCLERSGLDALLIFTRGHTFVGCWLSQGSFKTTVVDDLGALQKRLDMQEIVVFDSTLLARRGQGVSFQQACEQGQKNLERGGSSKFICLVDIARARMQQIRPLALAEGFQRRRQQSLQPVFSSEITVEPTSSSIFDDAEESLDEDVAKKTESPKDRLDRWQRRLLDLSLRNSLLNYSMRRSRRYVEILTSNPGELEDRLSEGARFKLLGGLDLIEVGAETRTSVQLESLASRQIGKGSLVTPLNQKELDTRLTTLYRAARTTLEEGGANTLYLAYGFLSWMPEGRDKPCMAPLILIPARLERRSMLSGFTLSLSDDEPRFNTTLLELLRNDYDIFDLDIFDRELPKNDNGLDIDGIWRTVQHVVKDRVGWKVSNVIGLGLFSFAKYLMWKDLADNSEVLKENLVVSHLLSSAGSFPDEPTFMEPQELDEKFLPQDMYCPLLADSSQMSAIASAAKGKDFVLFGPPGTGKSQTIANIIAQCLAEKKTVLFVAEKTAALDVVYRRLKQIGLGDFCLELHSSKANKAEVLGQLIKASTSAGKADDDWQRIASRLALTRGKLNAYVRELHRIHSNGLSVYLAMGTVMKGHSCPVIPMSWPEPEYHDQAAREALFDVARKIKIQGPRARALAGTALRHIRREEWSPLWERDLLQSLEALCKAGERVSPRAQAAQAVCPLPFAEAEGETVEVILQLAERLLSAHGHAWLFALRPDAVRLVRQLKEAEALLDAYTQKWSALSVAYRLEAVDADLGEAQAIWALASSVWWPKSVLYRRKVEKILQGLCGAAAKPDCEGDLALLQQLQDLRKQIMALESPTSTGEQKTTRGGSRKRSMALEPLSVSTSGVFAAFATDRQELGAAVAFAESLHRCTGHLAESPEQVAALNTALEQLLGPGNMLLAKDGSVGRVLSDWVEAIRDYRDAASVTEGFLETELELSRLPLAETQSICFGIIEQKPHINAWCAWFRVSSQATSLGLQSLADAVAQGDIAPDGAEEALRVNYARWWIVQIVEKLAGLRSFVFSEHEQAVADFRELDETIRKMTSACIRGKLRSAASPEGNAAERRILQREFAKKRRHMPVRRLIESLPTLLPQLTPCLLMSPLSIAQYLAAGKTVFDLVIFDEASQIPVWDAIGAMARGRKVVVVGDPKQLPPTNFFQKTDDVEVDDDELIDDDLESILEECIAVGLPSLALRWHYRSRHESLITFSNRRYYNGDLVTFPSPDTEDKAVSFCFVEGVYERGTSRTNPIEAGAVVAELLSRLRSPEFQAARWSIGVVTFNAQQQTLIEDMLDAERRADPALERFFDSDLDEPVLVKNLENIQGYERDIMYFSIGFGPDQAGHVTMNFGALNKAGGERRLNVAVTRARHELKVFCSLYPDQILLAQTKAQGVRDLRLFLEYAQQGASAAVAPESGGAYESPFEQVVAEALQKRGWQVRPQVGVSAFRIDLGIVDPDSPGVYLAGVECDGYNYRRAVTARDRDSLREKVLRDLGWEVLRAWSSQWCRDTEAIADKLHAQLSDILERKRSAQANKERQSVSTHALPSEESAAQPPPTEDSEAAASETPLKGSVRSGRQDHMLRASVQAVVSSLSPVHENVLCAMVARQLGFSRAGSKIRANVLSMAAGLYEQSTEDVGTFFWDKGQSPETCVAFRKREKNEPCVVDEIAMPELVALARSIEAGSVRNPASLMVRHLGSGRLRTADRSRLETAWALSRIQC